jgi:hypothetical protein
VLVGGVVVEDHVDHLTRRDRPFGRVQEADELLMAVARHAATDDRAVGRSADARMIRARSTCFWARRSATIASKRARSSAETNGQTI